MHKFPLPAAGVLLLAVFAAQADDMPLYVGAGIGHVSVDRGSLSFSADDGGINGTGTAVSLLGGYFFSDNFGVEFGYHDYGSPTAFRQTGLVGAECPASFACPKVSGVTAEALGKMELAPELDGILRAGVLAWNVGSPGNTLLQKTSGEAFIYGVGVRKYFDYGIGVDVTYERSNFTTEETRVGINYSF